MAGKLDKAFIDNLQHFTDALENIVDILKEQHKKGGDAVNQMSASMDGDKLGQISEDIKKILDLSTNVDNRTKEILQEVKAARKQKETGLFGKVQDKDNEKKVKTGVEVIMLIAGGVLAIGLAFKLVGKVDFLSVVALSAGILMVSYAFSEIAKIKDLTPKKALMIGLALVIMSGAIALSSIVLQLFQPLNPMTMLSLVFVAGALGAAMLFVSIAIKRMDIGPKEIAKYLLLPIILPAIAGGIVLSSIVLQYMQPISWDKILSMAVVGIGLGIASIAVMFIMKALGKNPDWKAMAMTLIAIPIIAGGIVLASMILQFFEPIKDEAALLKGSFVIGLSILMFVPSVYILSKIGIKELLVGSLGIVTISAAIMISSWILSVGNYDKYPSLKWALGVGLSVLLFTPAVLALGIVAMTGIGALAIGAGALLVPVVATSIMVTSHILNMGNYDKYPTLSWAIGSGLALAGFGAGMIALGLIPFARKILDRGQELVFTVASAITVSSLILAQGNYKGGPTKEWAEGIGLALGAFSNALGSSTETSLFKKSVDPEKFATFMRSVAGGMIEVAKVLGGYDDWDSGYPTKEWAEGVSISLMPFVGAYEAMSAKQSLLGKIFGSSDDKFGDFMVSVAKAMVKVATELNKAGDVWKNAPDKTWADNISYTIGAFTESLGNLDEDKVDIIDDFADSISKLAKALNKLNFTGIDSLKNLTTSITIMSAVDETKLKQVLSVLDDNKKELSNIMKIEGPSGQSQGKQVSPQVTPSGTAIAELKDNTSNQILLKFDNVLEKFDELLEYVVQSNGGENVNSDDKIQGR